MGVLKCVARKQRFGALHGRKDARSTDDRSV